MSTTNLEDVDLAEMKKPILDEILSLLKPHLHAQSLPQKRIKFSCSRLILISCEGFKVDGFFINFFLKNDGLDCYRHFCKVR